jgi:hypothetical protein
MKRGRKRIKEFVQPDDFCAGEVLQGADIVRLQASDYHQPGACRPATEIGDGGNDNGLEPPRHQQADFRSRTCGGKIGPAAARKQREWAHRTLHAACQFRIQKECSQPVHNAAGSGSVPKFTYAKIGVRGIADWDNLPACLEARRLEKVRGIQEPRRLDGASSRPRSATPVLVALAEAENPAAVYPSRWTA